jgi:hypothetical protein
MIEIRSYRTVFDLERRIYRVDRLRLNPGGVPVRGVVYFVAILALCLISGHVPLLGAAARDLPWYLRDLALPGASATILSVIRIEGRPFHQAAHALVRYRMRPRASAGGHTGAATGTRWWPDEILMLPDGSDGSMRRLRYTGPGAVLVAVTHERSGRASERELTGHVRWGGRHALVLRPSPDAHALQRAQVIALAPRARLLVNPRMGKGR